MSVADDSPIKASEPSAMSGHPRGLYTLFFTEMWERFSYYGMRALLVLFLAGSIESGGMGLDEKTAAAIYGLYTAFVYLVALPGGWIADRLLGAQRCIWYGGIIIAAGHFTLAVPNTHAFFFGLVLIVAGTGLLKPNISAIVGQLYPEGGGRRDAGFTIFYMGINLGATLGPLVCSWLGEKWDWHYGFASAGVGMLLGLLQFKLTAHHLGGAGLHPAYSRPTDSAGFDKAWLAVGLGVALAALVVSLGLLGVIPFHPIPLAKYAGYVIVGVAVLYFISIFIFGRLNGDERRRIAVLIALMLGCAVFWSGFEQAGSSLNVFAKDYTQLTLPVIDYEIPAGWFQSVNAIFIIVLSPFVAAFWIHLARRRLNPSIPMKFVWALVVLGLSFFVMAYAAKLVASGSKVLPTWLITTYFLHTVAELCLSPVGLSAVTKLAPARYVGQMMGLWFVATSLGNLIAGLVAGEVLEDPAQMSNAFLDIAKFILMAAAVLLLLVIPMKKWIRGIE